MGILSKVKSTVSKAYSSVDKNVFGGALPGGSSSKSTPSYVINVGPTPSGQTKTTSGTLVSTSGTPAKSGVQSALIPSSTPTKTTKSSGSSSSTSGGSGGSSSSFSINPVSTPQGVSINTPSPILPPIVSPQIISKDIESLNVTASAWKGPTTISGGSGGGQSTGGSSNQEYYLPKNLVEVQGLSPYQTRGTVSSTPTTQLYQSYEPYKLPLTNLGSLALKPVAQIYDTSMKGWEKIGDVTGAGWEKIAAYAGVPTKEFRYDGGTMPVAKRETININQPEQIFKQLPEQTIELSPKKIGETAKGIVNIGGTTLALMTPVVGTGLVAGQGISSLNKYQNIKVPTQKEIYNQEYNKGMEQLKSDPNYQALTPKEKGEYIRSPEFKDWEKQIDQYSKDYVSSIKQRKNVELLNVGLSAGFLVGGGIAKAINYEKQGVRLIDDFAKLPEAERTFTGVIQPQEKGAIAQIKEKVVMPDILGIEAPRYKTQIGRYLTGKVKGKPIVYKKGYETDVELFSGDIGLGKPTTAISLPGVKKGTYETLTKPSTYKGSPDEIILYEDVSKLQKSEKYVANKLLEKPTIVNDDTLYFGSRGQSTKGIRVHTDEITGAELRFMGRSKSSGDFLITSRPEVYSGDIISAGRVTPTGQINNVQFFAVDVATKKSTSQFIRASGKVDLARGEVAVLPKKVTQGITDTTFILPSGKKSEQGLLSSLSQKEAQKLSTKVGEIVGGLSPKVRTPKRYNPVILTQPEKYVFYPKYVGGLGRGISQYHAKGKTPEVDMIMSNAKLPPITKGSSIDFSSNNINANFKTLDYQPTKEINIFKTDIKDRTTDLFGITNKTNQRHKNKRNTGQIEIPREKETEITIPGFREIQIPREITSPVEGQREIQIPRLRTPQREIQILRLGTPQFQRPRPPFYPTPTTRTTFIPLFGQSLKGKRNQPRMMGSQIFYPQVKRYGKFIELGAEPTIERALAKGKQYAMTTLGASLRIRSGKGFVPLAPGGMFRTSKRSQSILVQRATQRLSARSERAEIIRSRRGVFKI